MTDTDILRIALQEIENQVWGITKQFFEIHDIVREAGMAKIDRIDRDRSDGQVIVYFPVQDERFYLAIHIQPEPAPEIVGIAIEAYNDIFFQASSETLNFDELSALTILKPTNGWRKGETRKAGRGAHSYSLIRFIPDPGPDEFNDKLKKLLDFLEQDPIGVKELVEIAEGHIQAAIIFHNGNTMLGGVHIDKESVKRMSSLNLEIDFDLYAKGKFFK